MDILLDMPVSPSLVTVGEAFGYESVHVSTLDMQKAPDSEILQLARDKNAVIVTADHDFPRLLALSAAEGPGLILFRGGNYSDEEMRELLRSVFELFPLETLRTSVSVVDKKRVRITPLPLR
jgi:predicted nuclease of predicted toxin-antitoxin system